MYKMISQLIGGGGWAGIDEDEEEDGVLAVTGPKVKRRQCTMATLLAWYKVGEGLAQVYLDVLISILISYLTFNLE